MRAFNLPGDLDFDSYEDFINQLINLMEFYSYWERTCYPNSLPLEC